MSRIIAYDMCRLFIGPYFATPRGIDRIDLAMANHVFADPDSLNIAILPTPLGVRAYPARIARLLLDYLQHVWGECASGEDDPSLQALIADIRSPFSDRAGGACRPAGLSRAASLRRSLAMVRHTGVRLGRSAGRAVPADAVYVNLGQVALAMPSFFDWLRKRPDIACAMMIHDTIPLDHPEMVGPASVAHHARMIDTAARYADCLIFSTAFAHDSVNAALARLRHAPLPGLVRSLPVSSAFANAGGPLPDLADAHYFVVVSTIEPRKNFGLLLRVWQRLVERMGAPAPHLVIVGARGREAERIMAPLERSPSLQQRVHQASGISSPALARLVSGCAGVLSPSYAEGFGLPLLEGIFMGVPTIASDIASHREIAHPTTTLVKPDDEAGWEAAVLATPRRHDERSAAIPDAMTEAAYCADVVAFLQGIEAKAPVKPRHHNGARAW